MAAQLPSEAFADIERRIAAVSRLADGLALIFISGPATHAPEALEDIASSLAESRTVRWHDLEEQGAEIHESLASIDPPAALIVHGLERLEESARLQTERSLNLTRDALPARGALIVFWIDSALLQEFQQACPDLFHWRTALLNLHEDDIPIPSQRVELRRLAQGLHSSRPVSRDLYFEPRIHIPGEESTHSLSAWASTVEHGALTGDPGGGKTVGILMYAADQARRALRGADQVVPVVLLPWKARLAPTKDQELDFVSLCMASSFPWSGPSEETVRRLAATGRLQIIVDAFDEIPVFDRKAYTEWLLRIRDRHSRVRTLVVTRPSTFEAPGWEIGEVQHWGRETVVKFLEKTTPGARRLIKELDKTGLLDAWRQPALLGILSQVAKDHGHLPVDPMGLLDLHVRTLMERDAGKGSLRLRTTTSPQEWRRRLAELALAMLLEGRHPLQLPREVEELEGMEPELLALADRTGLLRRDPDGRFSFRDQTIFSYFAASGLIELGPRGAAALMQEHKEDPRWTDISALAASRLLELLADGDDGLRDRLEAFTRSS